MADGRAAAPACPVCRAPALPPFLRRAGVPVHQNLVARTRAEALAVPRGDLALAACAACGFVFNAAFDPARLRYGAAYDNTQTCSPAFAAHVDGLVRHLVEDRGVRGVHVVEVGCGKGDFLRRLVGWPGAGNTGTGFDPSYVGPDADLEGRLRFERRYYGPEWAHVPADVVVCRHVIEHVPDPVGLATAVRLAIAGRPGARVFFETPCVAWILRHQVVWDVFYEHCSYFTTASLASAFGRAGFQGVEVRHVFGGQYLWLEAGPADGPTPACPDPLGVPALAAAFAAAERQLLAALGAELVALAARGPVALWGAGAKGSTLANLVDPDGDRLACVVDINPNKVGGFLPGTGHPIVAPAALDALGVRTAILLNPLYRAECQALLDDLRSPVELVDGMGRWSV